MRGAERSDVEIRAIRRGPQERLATSTMDVRQGPLLVTIDADRSNTDSFGPSQGMIETQLEIVMPIRGILDLNVNNGTIDIESVAGPHSIRTHTAGVRIRGVSDESRVVTHSGDIRVEVSGREEIPGLLSLETFSGDITVRLSPRIRAALSFESIEGMVHSDLPFAITASDSGGLHAAINGGQDERIQVKTFSGDLRIQR